MKPGKLVLLLVVALSLPCWADDVQGSSTVVRTYSDLATGQVYIYAGGSFAAGEKVNTFSWTNSQGIAGDLTPILFQQTSPGVFTVAGVGSEVFPSVSLSPQSAAFNLQYGTDTTTSGNFTFGFINATVNGSGAQIASSTGTVDFDSPVVGGQGVGGTGTSNDWVFTPTVGGINVALGTTFYTPGNSGDFVLNDPSQGGSNDDRTYSATLSASPVPEPGTLALLGSALMGLAPFKRRRS